MRGMGHGKSKLTRELPKGNPITGREWDKDRPDTGSYEGGTFPEDSKLGRDGTARGWSGA